jgi:hypothetical protein
LWCKNLYYKYYIYGNWESKDKIFNSIRLYFKLIDLILMFLLIMNIFIKKTISISKKVDIEYRKYDEQWIIFLKRIFIELIKDIDIFLKIDKELEEIN